MKTSTLKTRLFCLVLTIAAFTSKAQIKPTSQILKPVIQKHGNSGSTQQGSNGSTQQPTGSPQTQPSSPVLTDADYFLAVAKITVKTGKDNKENGSSVILRVYPNAGADNWRKGYNQENYKSELKIWSTNNFTLPRAASFDQNFNSLANYKQAGIMVDINYNTAGNGPFFALDAWKIDEVGVTLEFKDKNGNPHPTMGSKTIYFTDSNMYLDFKKWQLYCKTDQYFNTLTPFITNRPIN